MVSLAEALYVIRNSKRFDFEEGPNGMTILAISNYYTGSKVYLDLAKLDETTLEQLQVPGSTDDLNERCRKYIHDQLYTEDEKKLAMLLDKVAEHREPIRRIDYEFYTYLHDLVLDFCGAIGIDADDNEYIDADDFINNQLY